MLGIDIGTNACKAALFDTEGRLIFRASKEYPVLYPQPTWAEQNADMWWNAVRANIKEILLKIRDHSKNIVGIAVDSQREAVVHLDAHERVLANSLIWLDQRTMPQAEKIRKLLPARKVIETALVPIDYFYSATKIMWMKENRPGIFKKTQSLLFPKDYVVFKLTSQKTTDHSMASRSMIFDVSRRRWSEELCDGIGIPVSLLPPSTEATDVVGEITLKAAATTGLATGTPVVSGGGDRPCEAIGAGMSRPMQLNIGTGTATVMTTPLVKAKADSTGRIDCCCHVIPNRWEYEIVISTTGASLRWFRDNFASEEVQKAKRTDRGAYEYLDQLAQQVKPGSDGLFYYPYPMGAKAPRFSPNATAVFFGLKLMHKKAHLVRSILEGVAFQYADSLELLKDLGVRIKEASIVGGEARSSFWNQIKANALGRPVRRPAVEDAATLGSAILASVGIGIHSSVERAVRNMVRIEKIYRPRSKERQIYTSLCQRYWQIYSDVEKAYGSNPSFLTR